MTIAWPPARLGETPVALDAWNALVSRCGAPFPLSAKGSAAVIELVEPPASAQVAALVEAGGSRAVVVIDAFPFAALFEAAIEAEDLERLPIALRDVLVEGVVSAVWRLIPQNKLPGYRLLGVGDWQDGAKEAGQKLTWLSIAIQGLAPQPARLRVGCLAIDVARALLGERFASRAAWTNLRSSLLLDVRLLLGCASLPLAEARALKPGDVVVLADDATDTIRARTQSAIYLFRRSQDKWRCAACRDPSDRGRETKDEVRSMDSSQDDGARAEPAPLSELLLDVDFDIGGLRLPLATIETWQVGAAVELDAPDVEGELEVTVRVSGQAVAKGDLIRIDKRFAVRISRLLIRAASS